MKKLIHIFAMLFVAMAKGQSVDLIQIPKHLLTPSMQKKISDCEEDISAALDLKTFQQLPHAKPGIPAVDSDGNPIFDEGEPLFSFGLMDGGTKYWRGEGYTITVLHRFSSIGGVRGILFGPEVELNAELTGNGFGRMKISYVRFISEESSVTKPNQALEPTPTAVTERAAHAPRQP